MSGELIEGIKTVGIIAAGCVTVGGGLVGVGVWIGRVNNDRQNFREFVKEVRGKLDTILFRLGKLSGSDENLVQTKSPVVLTEKGEKVAQEIGALTFASELAPKLVKKVKGKEEFQIYAFCEEYVQRELPEKWETIVEKYAYNHGLPQYSILMVLAVVLRDKLLDDPEKQKNETSHATPGP